MEVRLDIKPSAPNTNFECYWCKTYSKMDPDEYTCSSDEFGGWDSETNKPICINCAAEAEAELLSE